MLQLRNWLERCDDACVEADSSFLRMYPKAVYKSWKDVVVAHGLTNVRKLSFSDIRHIVVLETADGSINQVLSLRAEDEHFNVYSGVGPEHVFNTDGSAFIQFIKADKEIAVFHIDNSPYDVDEYACEDISIGIDSDFNLAIALQEFKNYLKEQGVPADVTMENTIFVSQL